MSAPTGHQLSQPTPYQGGDGLNVVECSCGVTVRSRSTQALAAFTVDHTQHAGKRHHTSAIISLHADLSTCTHTGRQPRGHRAWAVAYCSCGQWWEAPVKAAVEETKRSHRDEINRSAA